MQSYLTETISATFRVVVTLKYVSGRFNIHDLCRIFHNQVARCRDFTLFSVFFFGCRLAFKFAQDVRVE